MNKEHIVDAMGRIDDDMIETVEKLRQNGADRKRPWVKWGVIAAACLTVVLILPFALNMIKGNGDIDGPISFDDLNDFFDDPYDDSVHSIAALEYNGCFYEAVDIPDVLAKYGLPKRITSDMAGEHLSYLESDGGCGYRQTISQTDIELYVYAPKPCRGVYVLRDGDTWYAALFCNFIHFDSDTHCEFTELYRVYGIESAEDIASITEVDWNNDKVVGSQITDSKEISDFYDITLELMPYGNDSFQKLMFSGFASEEDQIVKHTQFADDLRSLRIETTSGLRFHISVYPTFDWIYGNGAMTYYQMNDLMIDWFERNMG